MQTDRTTELLAELPTLYTQLQQQLGARHLLADERSTPTARTTWWCTTHRTAHHPSKWNAHWGEPGNHESCQSGPDPRGPGRVAHLASATVTATPRRDRQGIHRSGPPGSAAPLDIEVLTAQEDIWTACVDLLADLRYALRLPERPPIRPHEKRAIPPTDPIGPLIDALSDAQRAGRWLTVHLARLDDARTRARGVLGLDPELLKLGPCPNVVEAYPAVWDPSGIMPLAMWDDGLCRRYNVRKSQPAASPDWRAVDVWDRSHLVVDVAAGTKSPDGDIVCRTCRRRWAGEPGRRELAGLMMAA